MFGESAPLVSPGLAAKLVSADPCNALDVGSDEVLIHAPGFEDRTMASPQLVSAKPGARALLLDYRPFDEKNRMGDVRNCLAGRGVTVADDDILVYDRFVPGDFQQRLRARVLATRQKKAIVDISTMSKLAILLVLDVCRQVGLSVRVFYAEATEYGPAYGDYASAKADGAFHRPSIQIYTGIHGVIRVDSLASVAMQGEPTAAIVFMSFNDALTQALLNTVFPSRLFLINGRPPLHSWREEAVAWIHDHVRREWERDNPVVNNTAGAVPTFVRTVSTRDYQETVALLLSLYWQLSATHRILLAPAGSKMQAFGCYVFKALHPDVHIEYPSPKGFFKEYSTGIGEAWLLDLGDLGQWISGIAAAERRDYLQIPVGDLVGHA